LVHSGSKPEHGYHASHHKGDVEHCIDISHKRELNIDELKVLEKQNDRIEEISTQEGRRIDHNSIYVLSTDIHNAKSQQEPWLKTLWINQINSGKAAKSSIKVRFLGINHRTTGLNHYFPSLEIDESRQNKQRIHGYQKCTECQFKGWIEPRVPIKTVKDVLVIIISDNVRDWDAYEGD
jgi:hypothetical protein